MKKMRRMKQLCEQSSRDRKGLLFPARVGKGPWESEEFSMFGGDSQRTQEGLGPEWQKREVT